MNLDLSVIQRDGYTLLDLLSDVGGLQGILISAFSLLLGIWNHNYLESYIASKVYKVASTGEEEPVSLEVPNRANIKECCIDRFLPAKLTRVCCKIKRKEIEMQEAREALANEIDIIRMLQTRRFYHLAFRHLLDAPVRKQIEQQSEYTILGGEKSRKASHFVNRGVIQFSSN